MIAEGGEPDEQARAWMDDAMAKARKARLAREARGQGFWTRRDCGRVERDQARTREPGVYVTPEQAGSQDAQKLR